MDFKKAQASQQVKKEVADGVHAAMAPQEEQIDEDIVNIDANQICLRRIVLWMMCLQVIVKNIKKNFGRFYLILVKGG